MKSRPLRRLFLTGCILFTWVFSSISASAASLGTWRAVASGATADINAAAFGDGTFVAVGAAGLILTSVDGTHWTRRSAGITRDFNDVLFSGGRFIAVCKAPDAGVGAKIFISTNNGVSWAYRNTDTGGDAISVGLHATGCDGNGNLIAVGGFGWVTRSNDNGQTWHVLANKFSSADLYGITYGNGIWVATGIDGVFHSTDGSTWTKATQSFSACKVAFGKWPFRSDRLQRLRRIEFHRGRRQMETWTKAAGFTADLLCLLLEWGNLRGRVIRRQLR